MLRHVEMDQWGRGDSFLHRRDGRAKLIVLLALLAWIGTSRHVIYYFPLLAVAAVAAKLSAPALVRRASWVLPFTLTFALITAVTGDWGRAGAQVARAYASAIAVVMAMACTPLPELLRAAQRLGAPALLISVAQFIYRYLFVLIEQAMTMRLAASARGGVRWSAAGGAAAMLFGSAHERAERIHRSMLARGHTGKIPLAEIHRFDAADIALIFGTAVALAGGRIVWGL